MITSSPLENDQIAPPSDARRLYDLVPRDKSLVIVPGVDHATYTKGAPEDARATYERAVLDFLADIGS